MHIFLMYRGSNLWLGGSQYINNLAQALNALPAGERKDLRITAGAHSDQQIEQLADIRGCVDELVNIESAMAPFSLSNKVRWRLKRTFTRARVPRLEEYLLRIGVDFAFPTRPRLAWTDRLRFAEWIPDFQYDYFPDGSNPQEVAARKADNEFVTAHLPRIVVSSLAAESDCHRLFPSSRGKTFILRFRVTPPPLDPLVNGKNVLREYHLPDRFFLVSNMFAPTKNHVVVFEALKELATRGCRPVIAFTGSLYDYRNPEFANTILTAISRAGVWDQVRLLGIIPRRDQLYLMRKAVAVIQPSLFEGWSTSVEEARALGRPLIVSDILVHREQNVPWAKYFDPRSPNALADQLLAAWDGSICAVCEEEARTQYTELTTDYARTFLRLARGEPS